MMSSRLLILLVLPTCGLGAETTGEAAAHPASSDRMVQAAAADAGSTPIPPAAVGVSTPTQPDAASPYRTAQDFIRAFGELEAALQDVRDQTSADAAAPQTRKACTRILDLLRAGHFPARPDEAAGDRHQRHESHEAMEEQAKTALTRLLTVYYHNCHGSGLLRDAIQPLMDELLEGADTLDEQNPSVPDVPDVAQPD